MADPAAAEPGLRGVVDRRRRRRARRRRSCRPCRRRSDHGRRSPPRRTSARPRAPSTAPSRSSRSAARSPPAAARRRRTTSRRRRARRSPAARRSLLQRPQVVLHQRLQRGVDRRRGRPPVLADDRVQLVRERERHLRPLAREQLADAQLVLRVDDRPDQADRDRLGAAGAATPRSHRGRSARRAATKTSPSESMRSRISNVR